MKYEAPKRRGHQTHTRPPSRVRGTAPPRTRRLALVSILTAACALILAVPAPAKQTHAQISTFTASSPAKLAIDQSAGFAYSLSPSGGSITKYSIATGEPANFSALGSSVINGVGEGDPLGSADKTPQNGLGTHPWNDIAVDNSGGPANGNIYVADVVNEGGLVEAFNSAGEYLYELGGYGNPCGVAVDGSGNLYVSSFSFFTVFKFATTATSATPDATHPEIPIGSRPCHIAATPGGDLYVVTNWGGGGGDVTHFSAASGYANSTVVDPGPAFATVVDPASSDLYVALGDRVRQYNSSDNLLSTFGSSNLVGAQGLAIQASTNKVLVADEPSQVVRVFGPVTIPDVTTGEAVGVTQTTATLEGHVDPAAAGNITGCQFEYGSTTSYGQTASCETTPPSAPPYSAATDVHADITGLSPGLIYHYRLDATNANGTSEGQDLTLETHQAPTIDGLYSSNATEESADLHAKINPQGFDTTYRFEYGTTSAYGASTPIPDEDIGAASTDQPVTVHLSSLQVGATYHFRVVATNEWGTTASEDQTFNFLPPNCPNSHIRQQTGGEFLPDCRAYELVSPSNAGNVVFFPEAGPVGPDATSPPRFGFGGALGAIEGTEPTDSSVDSYVATRSNTGWTTHYVGIPGSKTLGSGTAVGDLGFDKFIDFKTDGGFPGVPQPLSKAPYVWNADGSPLGRWPANIGAIPGGDGTVGAFQPSPDFSHLAFSSNNVDFTAGQGGEEGLTTAPGSAYDYNTLTETTKLISRDANGQYIQQQPTNSSSTGEFVLFPSANQSIFEIHANPAQMYPGVSTDGSHILMSTANTPYARFSNPRPLTRLYMRVDDAVTYEVSQGHSVNFVGMTADGSKVLFTSSEQLTADDHDSSIDLYMWSEATNSLTRLSTGNNGAGNSDACSASWVERCGVAPVEGTTGEETPSETDNSFATGSGDIYFYSPEQLDGSKGVPGLRNLYLYRGGQVEFVTTLAPNKPVTRVQVSPDGAHAAFVTASRVTSSDNAGFQEMYSFEPSSGALVCVSCDPRGNPPSGNVQASVHGIFMSNDGRTFFYSPDALVPQDTNGLHDVYEFVEGRPQLITSGLGSSDKQVTVGHVRPAGLEGVSGDGVNVYFSTYDTLVPQDRNGQFLKFYDARSGGGFPVTPPVTPCAAADECHGAGNPQPEAPTIASEADLGAGGNAAAGARGGKRHHRHRRSLGRRGHPHTHSGRPAGRRGG